MLRFWVILLAPVIANAVLGKADVSQIVKLGYATYQGTFNSTTNITSFFGLRYATPPIGNLRFQGPRPPATVEGIQPADEQHAICLMSASGGGTLPSNPFSGLFKRASPPESEDCLFLNVFVPGPVNSKATMPVVVWIHGGGYIRGSGSGSDGADIIRDAKGLGGGVIAITIEYRLGIFGFLAGSVVKQRGTLNAGILDQRAALQWVQQHIHNFGGDPSKVTIWGQSAGAGSVLQHMIADGGNTQPPLFHAAIFSSLFVPSQFRFDGPVPEKIFSDVVQQTSCTNASDHFACLVAADVSPLQAANANVNNNAFFGTFSSVPVIDGSLIRDSPTKIIKAGKMNGKVLLAMNNQFEGRTFVNQNFANNTTTVKYVQSLFPGLSTAQSRAVASMYQDVGFNTVFDQIVQVMGDSIFVCPTNTMLRNFKGQAFKGEFAVPPGTHAADVIYYFPGDIGPPFNNTQFVTSFSQSFLAVIKSFDPNAFRDPNNITPQWLTYSHGNFEMLFNKTDAGQPLIRPFSTDPNLLARCLMWERLSSFTHQ